MIHAKIRVIRTPLSFNKEVRYFYQTIICSILHRFMVEVQARFLHTNKSERTCLKFNTIDKHCSQTFLNSRQPLNRRVNEGVSWCQKWVWYDTKHNQKWQMGAMWHKTQCTENLFRGRTYLPDPVPPAHAPASVFAAMLCVDLTKNISCNTVISLKMPLSSLNINHFIFYTSLNKIITVQ